MTSTSRANNEDSEAVGTGQPTGEPGRQGPAVVALGGGHGLAASLRAARGYAGDLTGVVSVGDDGGSSGQLRSEFGVAAPGDVRRCISALASGNNLLGRSLEYRFEEGVLEGHPIGNLLITGLAMAAGDFQVAVDELCRLVEVDGSIYPATTVPVSLLADSDRGVITGQVRIELVSGIRNLRFDPADPPVPANAIKAVAQADQVIIGPGSLYTSVLATAVVPRIKAALQDSPAQRVFVANVANERAMAHGFGLREHVEALADHGVPIDLVVASGPPAMETIGDTTVCWADVAADDGWGHDSAKLGQVLHELYHSGCFDPS